MVLQPFFFFFLSHNVIEQQELRLCIKRHDAITVSVMNMHRTSPFQKVKEIYHHFQSELNLVFTHFWTGLISQIIRAQVNVLSVRAVQLSVIDYRFQVDY